MSLNYELIVRLEEAISVFEGVRGHKNTASTAHFSRIG